MSDVTWADSDVPTAKKTIPTGGLGFVIVAAICIAGGIILGGLMIIVHLLLSGISGLVGLVFAAAFIGVFILITRFFPGFRWKMAMLAYLWGASGSLILVTIGGDPWQKITASMGLRIFEMSFGGAYPEEIAKGFGVLILVWLWGKRPADGLIYGMWVGVGFEVFENYLYGLAGGLYDPNSDLHGVLTMWMYRTLAGPGLHVMFSGFVGFGVACILYGRYKGAWWLLAGAAFHFGWNMMWDHSTLSMIVVAVLAYPLFIWLFVTQWRQEARGVEYEERLYIP